MRPGPIQGDMVHPFLRRRQGIETVVFPSKDLEQVLGKTLGIPLFQEQAMKIAIVGAGFSPSEADALRRAMATFRHFGEIHTFRTRFIDGMLARGYEQDFAERCFKQIEGFADYGFPESHAASFALLVYVSSWIKRHYPAAFAAALLNSQPMGFYAPAQIIRDARDHGVEVRPADVNASDWDYTLEDGAIRLGLRQIKGLGMRDAEALLDARGAGYANAHEIWRRAGLGRSALETLARADAFVSMGLNRRAGLWAVRGLGDAPLPLFAAADTRENSREAAVLLPEMAPAEQVADDYRALRLSLKGHPVGQVRDQLEGMNFAPCVQLQNLANGQPVRVAGLVITRQRPGSAKGVIFVTIEDETGIANLVVYASIFERFRKITLGAGLLGVQGRVQREGIVIHVTAEKLFDLTPARQAIRTKSRDFH